MRFFYENNMGDIGYFSENDLVKAIYTAWNIEATLYLLNDGVEKIDWNELFRDQCKIIFSPYDGNEFNSDVLKEFGYKMEDRGYYREIIDLETDEIVRYDWGDVEQLV